MKILMAEDDVDTLLFLKARLEQRCFAVDTAERGDEALRLAQTNEYDLIVLDYSLPGQTGYQICERLRKSGKQTPIMALSLTNELSHKLEGFDLGIDDYLVKPFFFEEFLARIRAILRRPKRQYSSVLVFEDLVLDSDRQVVTRGDVPIYLTRKEFSLLEYLIIHARMVVSRGSLIEHVWDMNANPFSNTIETHILNLRKKLNLKNCKPLIHSVQGRGYKLDTKK